MDVSEILKKFGDRFSGFDIQYRRNEPNWVTPIRLKRVVSKNERKEYREIRYFRTFEDLFEYLDNKVKED